MYGRIVAVVPARYASQRLLGKPLVDIGGLSMIRRVYEAAASATMVDAVIVATDDGRVVAEVESWGGNVVMTGEHPSGTDRVAEVASALDCSYIVNVQGDEPLLDPQHIDGLCQRLVATDGAVVTLATPIVDPDLLYDYNVVKVVFDHRGRSIYFSRAAIPARRDLPYNRWLDGHVYYQHLGLYGYSRAVLQSLMELEPSPLEQAESLEQLRWLEHGYRIDIVTVDAAAKGVDTPEDLERVRRIISLR